jgi:ParB family chromosome partitioning protein
VAWANRITGYGTKHASQFMAHPLNWRKHPQRQRSAVKGSLDSLGWVSVVIENQRTGNLVDGHERIWQALQNNDAEVPFITVDLSPEEEAQALLSLDAIAALAQTDAGKVDELLRMVETDNTDVMQFMDDLAKDAGVVPTGEGEWGAAFDGLPDEDRAPFQQMTFTLHDSQVAIVKDAIKKANSAGDFKDSPNENGNGNALAAVCEAYLNG